MGKSELENERNSNASNSSTEAKEKNPTSKRVPDLIARVEEESVRFIDLQFTDIFGGIKSVTIPAKQLPSAMENGVWFDGSAIEGFARVAENDMYLVPDPSTFTVVPWTEGEDKTARVICWVYTPRGERFTGDPRYALDRVLKEAAGLGYQYNAGPELEFFLFNNNHPLSALALAEDDRSSYFDHSSDSATMIKRQAARALESMGVEFESFHHEVAPGQHEIDLEVGPALLTADNVMTAKYVLRAIAKQNGMKATFMPKPLFGVPGSGMHTHQSLTFSGDSKSGIRNGQEKMVPSTSAPGENAFTSMSDQYNLSAMARHFIAGQLYHAKAMTIILAPIINSYKRLVAGYEAPVYISWARVNRGALIRVPHSGPGTNQRYAARLELRCPDPSCNPYLAFAVMLKAGLDGIKRKLPLPEPIEESIFQFDATELRRRSIETLPSTMREAIDELNKDDVIQEALGDVIYENFVEAKLEEWSEYRRHVSPWEVERYLDNS
ncbi:MAG TPA: glutamine synthetase family protein [Chloroflexia bacterium]|nr:glutamine synthetase family protein [Chloroflexia bacterium]